MTNEEIIFKERIRLLESGDIGTTGKILKLKDKSGQIKSFPEPEEIHTYAAWRERGFQVRRGECAVTCIRIWKHTKKKCTENEKPEERMIATNAYFFASSQVKLIKGDNDNECKHL